MVIEELVDFSLRHLKDEANRSGKVLYSSAATLSPGPIYLLGINPGGSPENYLDDTIRVDLKALPNRTANAYLDEVWEIGPAGSRPIQRRVHWLLTQLGLETRRVAASNMLFQRTSSESALEGQFDRFAHLCWPIHRRILEIVKPAVVVTYGGSPYDYLKKKFGPSLETTLSSGHGNWMCRQFHAKGRFQVVGLPHFARYDVVNKFEVVEWLASTLAGA